MARTVRNIHRSFRGFTDDEAFGLHVRYVIPQASMLHIAFKLHSWMCGLWPTTRVPTTTRPPGLQDCNTICTSSASLASVQSLQAQCSLFGCFADLSPAIQAAFRKAFASYPNVHHCYCLEHIVYGCLCTGADYLC